MMPYGGVTPPSRSASGARVSSTLAWGSSIEEKKQRLWGNKKKGTDGGEGVDKFEKFAATKTDPPSRDVVEKRKTTAQVEAELEKDYVAAISRRDRGARRGLGM